MAETAKVFMNGASQAVRLPKEFRFEGDEVCIKRVGSTVVLYDPADRLNRLMSAVERFPGDFMDAGRDQGGPPDVREAI